MVRSELAYTFGVISDVQWADIDDGSNFDGSIPRYFRGAFKTLQRAVDWWNERALFPQPEVGKRHGGEANTADPARVEQARGAKQLFFVAQIGDLVDVHNNGDGTPAFAERAKPSRGSHRAMERSLEQLHRRLRAPVLHSIGNHEIYTYGRERGGLDQLYRNPFRLHESYREGKGGSYHSFSPAPGHRIVTLDAYQDAVIGWAPDDPRRVHAPSAHTKNMHKETGRATSRRARTHNATPHAFLAGARHSVAHKEEPELVARSWRAAEQIRTETSPEYQ